MLQLHGGPQVYVSPPGAEDEEDGGGIITSMERSPNGQLVAVATPLTVSIYQGERYRAPLAFFRRTADSKAHLGTHVRLHWSADNCSLVAETTHNRALLIYSLVRLDGDSNASLPPNTDDAALAADSVPQQYIRPTAGKATGAMTRANFWQLRVQHCEHLLYPSPWRLTLPTVLVLPLSFTCLAITSTCLLLGSKKTPSLFSMQLSHLGLIDAAWDLSKLLIDSTGNQWLGHSPLTLSSSHNARSNARLVAQGGNEGLQAIKQPAKAILRNPSVLNAPPVNVSHLHYDFVSGLLAVTFNTGRVAIIDWREKGEYNCVGIALPVDKAVSAKLQSGGRLVAVFEDDSVSGSNSVFFFSLDSQSWMTGVPIQTASWTSTEPLGAFVNSDWSENTVIIVYGGCVHPIILDDMGNQIMLVDNSASSAAGSPLASQSSLRDFRRPPTAATDEAQSQPHSVLPYQTVSGCFAAVKLPGEVLVGLKSGVILGLPLYELGSGGKRGFCPDWSCWAGKDDFIVWLGTASNEKIPFPPETWVSRNWPVQQCAVSPLGSHVLVTGQWGFALYRERNQRWSLLARPRLDELHYTAELPMGWLSNSIFYITHTHPANAADQLQTQDVYDDHVIGSKELFCISVFDVDRRLDSEEALLYAAPLGNSRPLTLFQLKSGDRFLPSIQSYIQQRRDLENREPGECDVSSELHFTQQNDGTIPRVHDDMRGHSLYSVDCLVETIKPHASHIETRDSATGRPLALLQRNAKLPDFLPPQPVIAVFCENAGLTAFSLSPAAPLRPGSVIRSDTTYRWGPLWTTLFPQWQNQQALPELHFAGSDRILLAVHGDGCLTALVARASLARQQSAPPVGRLMPRRSLWRLASNESSADMKQQSALVAEALMSVPFRYFDESAPLLRNVDRVFGGVSANFPFFVPIPSRPLSCFPTSTVLSAFHPSSRVPFSSFGATRTPLDAGSLRTSPSSSFVSLAELLSPSTPPEGIPPPPPGEEWLTVTSAKVAESLARTAAAHCAEDAQYLTHFWMDIAGETRGTQFWVAQKDNLLLLSISAGRPVTTALVAALEKLVKRRREVGGLGGDSTVFSDNNEQQLREHDDVRFRVLHIKSKVAHGVMRVCAVAGCAYFLDSRWVSSANYSARSTVKSFPIFYPILLALASVPTPPLPDSLPSGEMLVRAVIDGLGGLPSFCTQLELALHTAISSALPTVLSHLKQHYQQLSSAGGGEGGVEEHREVRLLLEDRYHEMSRGCIPIRILATLLRATNHYLPDFFRAAVAALRKTEPLITPHILFPLLGILPAELFMICEQEGDLETASKLLTLLELTEGRVRCRRLYALPLLGVALKRSRWPLALSLVRFTKLIFPCNAATQLAPEGEMLWEPMALANGNNATIIHYLAGLEADKSKCDEAHIDKLYVELERSVLGAMVDAVCLEDWPRFTCMCLALRLRAFQWLQHAALQLPHNTADHYDELVRKLSSAQHTQQQNN